MIRPARRPDHHRLDHHRRATTASPVMLLVTVLSVLSVLVGALTGCATRAPEAPGAPPSSAAASAFPVELAPAGGPRVRLETAPRRIVSLNPASTEMLFAVGAGRQVIAVDDQSDYPPQAPRTDLSGFTPNLEAIVAHQPDLVVTSDNLGEVQKGLSAAGVPVLLLTAPSELSGAYQQMQLLGKATGHQRAADALVGRLRTEIDALVAGTPRPATPLTYFHELDPTLYSAGSKTFIGSIYSLFGLVNIADQPGNDYPQLSNEAVLGADPDLIFLADTVCCGQTPQTVASRPGWGSLSAVRGGGVVALDDDIASRWGPRVVDLVRAVSGAVRAAAERS